MNTDPQKYTTAYNSKTLVIQSMSELVAMYDGYAARVDHLGDIDLLVDSGEGTLVWVPITDLDVPDIPTKN